MVPQMTTVEIKNHRSEGVNLEVGLSRSWIASLPSESYSSIERGVTAALLDHVYLLNHGEHVRIVIN